MSEQGSTDKIRRTLRRAILRAFPPCVEVVPIISASLDRPLTMRERFVMKMHLIACRPCVRYLDQTSFLARVMKVLDGEEKSSLFLASLSEETRARIKELLRMSAMSF